MRRRLMVAAFGLALAGGGAALAFRRGGGEGGMMVQTILTGCTIKTATLNLVGERVMTRTAITAETIDRHAPPIRIASGDPRLRRLADILKTAPIGVPKIQAPEIRMLVRLECTDGTHHVIAGSRTGEDGRVDLLIDGGAATTNAPLRRELEALAG